MKHDLPHTVYWRSATTSHRKLSQTLRTTPPSSFPCPENGRVELYAEPKAPTPNAILPKTNKNQTQRMCCSGKCICTLCSKERPLDNYGAHSRTHSQNWIFVIVASSKLFANVALPDPRWSLSKRRTGGMRKSETLRSDGRLEISSR